MTSYYSSTTSPSLHNLIQTRATASLPFSQTSRTLINLTSPVSGPRPPFQVSPATSSPSLYSRVGHSPHVQMSRASGRLQVMDESDDSGMEEDDPRRMSMVGGPKVRKYTQVPWEEDWPAKLDARTPVGVTRSSEGRQVAAGVTVVGSADMFSGFNRHANRMISAVTSTTSRSRSRDPSIASTVSGTESLISSTSTRRGISHPPSSDGATPRHLLPSASGLSLASTQTASTVSSDDRPAPITPRLPRRHGRQASPTCASSASTRGVSYASTDDGGANTFLPAVESKFRARGSKGSTPNPRVDVFVAPDRPLLSSGSPGFGLISLEAAQERERRRMNGHFQVAPITRTEQAIASIPEPHPTVDDRRDSLTEGSGTAGPLHPSASRVSAPSSPPNRVRSKKSGLMRLFNKSERGPPPLLPTGSTTPTSKVRDRRGSVWSDVSAPAMPETAVWAKSTSRDKVKPPSHQVELDPPSPTLPVPKPHLELRPVSMTFARGLPLDYLYQGGTGPVSPSPSSGLTAGGANPSPPTNSGPVEGANGAPSAETAKRFKDQILNARKAWRVQLFELEAQIRELKDELDETRQLATTKSATSASGSGPCHACGCTCAGDPLGLPVHGAGATTPSHVQQRKVIDRARVKTAGARGVFGSGSLYEWE